MSMFDIVGDLNCMVMENKDFMSNESDENIQKLFYEIEQAAGVDIDSLLCDFQQKCDESGFRRGFKTAMLLFMQGLTGVQSIYGKSHRKDI